MYNAGAFIRNVITATQQQTHKDWELILVDDGSTDDTVDIVTEAASEDSRIKLLRKTPEGSPARSRNFGAKAATGEFLAFCDHDDFWAPEKLALQVNALRRFPEAVLCHTGRKIWHTQALPESFPSFMEKDLAPMCEQADRSLLQGCRVTHSSILLRTADYWAVGGLDPNLRGVDDYHLFFKLAPRGAFCRLPAELTYYYWHAANLSRVPKLFVEGLRQMADVLASLDPRYSASVRAQADKSEAVSLLATNPGAALRLLWRSWRSFRLKQTPLVAAVALLCLVVPPLRTPILKRLRSGSLV
jgi:glycosyltransferase involved in cell wall biosynthesis